MIDAILRHQFLRMKIGGGMMLLAGAYFAYDQYDKKTNFVPVQARVSSISETCYMEKRAGRKTTTSDTIACSLAQDLTKNHPKWQGFQVKQRIVVNYEYLSPVDKRTHNGQQTLSAYPDGKKLSRGQLIDVRASKTDPNKTREI